MSNVQSLIAEFAPKFESAVRADALAQLTSALGGTRKYVAPTLSKLEASSTGVVTRKAIKRAAKRGAKRTPEEIEKTQLEVLNFLTKNPSSSAEQIKSALKVDLKTIELPIAKLLEAKSIKKTGQKRATKYSAK